MSTLVNLSGSQTDILVLEVPLKNKRGQFGSGWWMVILNESGALQGENAGDGTKINVSMQSFFKEIPLQAAAVTT